MKKQNFEKDIDVTHKTIIDGVDVSGCCFYNSNGECCTSRVWEGYCKDCRKCMYKLEQQLKRKEQECEELKNTVDYLRREFKNIKWTNKAISKQCENLNCKDLQKLKQTLTEIKKIANKFDYWNNNLSQASEILHEIIEKISEVEALND